MRRLFRTFLLLLAVTLLPALPARAQLTIEIVGGAGTTIPVSIVPFENEATYPLGITGIVGADLARSGLFRLVDAGGIVPRPARPEEVRAADWRPVDAGPELVFEITADSFLHMMVRVAVGSMVDVAQGRLTLDGLREGLAGGRRAAMGRTAPARGLALVSVAY